MVHGEFRTLCVSGEHFRLTAAVAIERINVLLRVAGGIGDDGLTSAERAEVAARQADEARKQELARQARQAAADRKRELARREEAKRLANAEAERRRRAEYQRNRQMHKEEYWPRFYVLGAVGAIGVPMLVNAMLTQPIPTDFGNAIIGLMGVGIAAVISSGWADRAVAERNAGEARNAAALAAKQAREATIAG